MKRSKNCYNPCDDCQYGISKHNQEHKMCKICEFRMYRDLEEQKLLLKLPCKVGGELYDIQEFVDEYDHPEIYVIDASRVEISKDAKGWCYCIDGCDYREKHFGTVLFATKEEAEKALAEMEK